MPLIAPASPSSSAPTTIQSYQLHHRSYLPHIDGLRCIAVMAVLIYHIADQLCPAGFLGVDIFFVISGYLICGGIISDLQKGTFTLQSFYHRRIRRIFPAYFAVVSFTLLFALAVYHWGKLLPLAQTALFSTLFSGNIYFWLDMGYFQPNAHGNPLLNLWSLGVEEHFYLIIPLLCLLLWQMRFRSLKLFFAAGAALSLAACALLGHIGESTTAFYILPTRAWELLAGALIANLPEPRESARTRALAGVGLAIVVFSFWCLSTAKTFRNGGTSVEVILPFWGSLGVLPFPGVVTVPVILGTMLLVRYGASGPVSILLSSSPFVGIGKISYSLYLWHWPLFVFATYLNFEQKTGFISGLVFVLSFGAAYASWKWVETPARINKGFTPQVAFQFAAVTSALLISAAGFLIYTEGLRGHLHPQVNRSVPPPRPFMPNFYKFSSPPPLQNYAYPAFDTNYVRLLGATGQKPTFCLIGDSHAESLAPGLDKVAHEFRRTGYQVIPRIPARLDEHAMSTEQQLFRWVGEHPEVKDVYLAGRWLHQYLVHDGLAALGREGEVAPVFLNAGLSHRIEEDFRHTAKWLRARGKRLWVFRTVPDYGYAPSDILARGRILNRPIQVEITEKEYNHRHAPVNQILDRLSRENLLRVVALESAFIENGKTMVESADGEAYYRDADHLTPEGAYRAAKAIAPQLWPLSH